MMRTAGVTRVDFAGLLAGIRARAAGKRVIGFDVFDTLLRRRVDPEQVKDAVARRLARALTRPSAPPVDWRFVRHQRTRLEHLLGCEAEARGDDHEFRLRELAPRWIAACTANPASQASSVRAQVENLCHIPNGDGACRVSPAGLIAFEIACERRATLPTPGIERTLAALHDDGTRLISVSDNYLDLEDLGTLLAEHGLLRFFAAGYCSSVALRTKRSGRLYDEVLAAEGLAAGELLFVGDNPYSDVQTPRRLGIEVIHVADRGEKARRTRLNLPRVLRTKNRFWTGECDRLVIESLPRHLKAGQSSGYELGALLAPAFIAFARYVLEQAQRLGLERLLFLSREGLTFLRIYRRTVRALDAGCAALGGRDAVPPAAYLGVSRIATFLPSLDELSLRGLHRLLRQYAQQSLRQLLRNLSLPADEFLPLAQRHGIADADAPLERLDVGAGVDHEPVGGGAAAPDAPVARFLADPEVQRRFGAHRDRAQALLAAYLRQKGFFDGRRVGIVDIGWKGSIQDNLVRAVRHEPDRPEVHGLYFGLTHVAEDDLPGSFKHAYLADTRRGDLLEEVIFKNVSVFEMFASAAHGGVVGYRPRRPGAAQVRAAVKAEDVERRDFHRHAADVFAGIEDTVRDYLHVAPLLIGDAEDWRPRVLDRLRRYILYPTAAEARQFLRYSHMESFGVFHQSTYEFRGSWREILLGGPPWRLPRRWLETLYRQFWPEGCLRRMRLPLANFVYDLLKTRSGGRVFPP